MLEPPWASLRAGPRHASRGRADGSDDRVVTRASLGPGRASRACPPASPTCLAAPAPGRASRACPPASPSLPRGPGPGATPTPDPRPPAPGRAQPSERRPGGGSRDAAEQTPWPHAAAHAAPVNGPTLVRRA